MPNTTQIKIDPYSSSTGTGTLSYYANKYGTTVDNLVKLNPNISNPNLIFAGDNLNVPTVTQPAVMTSTPAATAVKSATDYVNGQQTSADAYAANQANKNTTTTTTTNTNPDIANINSTYDTFGNNLKTQLDSLTAGLDTSTQNMINSISNTYATRITQQKDLNERYQGATKVAGYASGRARYAPEIQQGILTKEEQDGLQRITDLEKERDDLIQKAKDARDEKKQSALMEYQNQLIEINKQKSQAVKDLYDLSFKTENLAIDKAKESRNSLKENLANLSTAVIPSLVDTLDTLKTSADKESIIQQYADQYGYNADTIKSLVQNYRQDVAKSSPEAVKEYEYYKTQTGYSGSLLDYMKLKKVATTVNSNANGTVLSREDATRWDLPESLIGKSAKQIVLDLQVSNPPQWFKDSQTKAGHFSDGMTPADLKSQWDIFRNTGDMLVLKNSIDVNKAGKDNATDANAQADAILQAINNG